MPKSRGRKHPQRKPARRPPVGSWQAQLARAAKPLARPGARREEAEQYASQLLGWVWQGRHVGDTGIVDGWVEDLTTWCATRRTPEAAVLLAAIALVLEHPRLAAELEAWGSPYLLDVPWAGSPPPVPLSASKASDVWSDVTNWFLEYDDHVLSIITKRSMSGAVTSLAPLKVDALSVWDVEMEHSEGEVLAREEVPVAEAVAALTRAQSQTEMFWPPNDDEDYVSLGHLLAARLRAVPAPPLPDPDEDWEGMSEEQKEELIGRFLAELEITDDEATREVLDACLWFGDSYMTGGPLAWSPGLVEQFLLDWLPRKTFLDPEVQRLVPTVTYAWTGWAMVQAGVPKRWADEAASVALELKDDFLEMYGEQEDSPTAAIARRIQESGATDQESVDRIVSAYNAEQLARRLLE